MVHKRIVIVGSGFGGLFCALGLVKQNVHITLIDRQNHHLFQPLLYQVATGFLGANDISIPVRSIFKGHKNIDIVMGNVEEIDAEKSIVNTKTHQYLYDYLVVATGSSYSFFGHESWQRYVHVLKKVEDALALRHHILLSLEKAELEEDLKEKKRLLTFVIVGGGPTGIELAGSVADLLQDILKREFSNISYEETQIILLEAAPRILLSMPSQLGEYAQKILERRGVKVYLNSPVKDIQEGYILTEKQDFLSSVIVWAAGVKPYLVPYLKGFQGSERTGILVKQDLSLPGYPHIFALGDCHTQDATHRTLPALAAVAKQQGQYVAQCIQSKIQGKNPPLPFRYKDRGNMAVIGRNAAVADFGKFQMKGWFAWVVWCVLHIFFLIGFRNRIMISLSWLWTYWTHGSRDRVISGEMVLQESVKVQEPQPMQGQL